MRKKSKIKIFSIIIITMMVAFAVQVFAKPGEIINTAPQVTLNTTPMTNRNISIGIVTDYEGPKLMALQNKVNQVKAELLSRGISADINYVTSNMNTYQSLKESCGMQSITAKKDVYVRYFNINYNIDCKVVSTTQQSGKISQKTYFDIPTTEKLDYELYVPQNGELPPNFKFSSSYRFDRYSMGEQHDHNFDSGYSYSQKDVYEAYDPQNEGDSRQLWSIYTREGATYNNGYSYDKDVTYHLTGTSLDNVWTKDKRDITVQEELFSLNTENYLKNYLNTVNYSGYDKKYLFLISDSDDTNDTWGSYNPFRDIKWTHSYPWIFSNMNIYSVLSTKTLDDTITWTTREQGDDDRYHNVTHNVSARKDILGKGFDSKLYDTGQYSKAFDDMAQNISDESGVGNPQYVIAGEQTVSYQKGYTDRENDPIGAEKWKYVQDPNYFENSNGTADFNGKELNAPVTKFDKVGKYTVYYQAQDNPPNSNNLLNYRKWSNVATAVIYVHRRPIANFYLSKKDYVENYYWRHVITVEEASYDWDHISENEKGIVEKKYRWKHSEYYNNVGQKVEAAGWIDGCPNQYNMHSNETITIEERVKDKEGAWSYPCIKTIKFDDVIPNNKPIALFTLKNNPMPEKTENIVTDKSFDPDGDNIAERHFWLLDSNSNVLKDYGNSIPPADDFKNLATGEYKLKEIVRDDPNSRGSQFVSLWSDPYILNFSVIPSIDLNAALVPQIAKQGQKITFTINTKGYVKYLKIFFPDELTRLDTNLPLYKEILEELLRTDIMTYCLPIDTPVTLDSSGNRIRPAYVIPVRAERADGIYKIVYLNLDVKDNIYSGIKTEMR